MISHALKIRSPGKLSLTAVLLAAALATAPAAAWADNYHHGYGGGWHHGGGGDYRHGGGNALGGVLLGLGIGAVVGGAIAQQNYAPPPPAYYAPPPPAYYAPPPPVYYASPPGY